MTQMGLEQYISLAQKKDFFQTGDSTINDFRSFMYVVAHLAEMADGSFYFRGVNDAKYMIYTTAQRAYIENNDYRIIPVYKDFIERIIQKTQTWNNNLIEKTMKSLGIDQDNYLSYFSLMQHASAISPCVDFSIDPLIALFFCFDGIKDRDQTGIDEFCSLYILDTRKGWHDFRIENIIKSPEIDAQLKALDISNGRFFFEFLFNSDSPQLFELTKNESFRMFNTMNILVQKGRLILNSSAFWPMEIVSKMRLRDIDSSCELELKCINFHKSIAPAALDYLEQRGITHESLFFQRGHQK